MSRGSGALSWCVSPPRAKQQNSTSPEATPATAAGAEAAGAPTRCTRSARGCGSSPGTRTTARQTGTGRARPSVFCGGLQRADSDFQTLRSPLRERRRRARRSHERLKKVGSVVGAGDGLRNQDALLGSLRRLLRALLRQLRGVLQDVPEPFPPLHDPEARVVVVGGQRGAPFEKPWAGSAGVCGGSANTTGGPRRVWRTERRLSGCAPTTGASGGS